MSNSGPLVSLSFLFLLTGCSPPRVAEFGPARKLGEEQRPTTWDAPTRVRLGLPDPKPAGDKPVQTRWTGTTPSGWEEMPPQPARFREAIWRVAGSDETECYLSAGVGGGAAMNMKRWYNDQWGRTEVPALEALPVAEIAGRTGRLVELDGTFMQKSDMAMLLAFYVDGEQLTTLKFTGPLAIVKGNREKFLELAKSLRMSTVSPVKNAPPIQPGQQVPPNHPPMPGQTDPHAGPSTPAPASSPFAATVPAGWTQKAGSPKVLHHTFGSDGEVYVSELGGAMKSTLDIWRGEMGLPALPEPEFQALAKVDLLGAEATMLDAAGDYTSFSGKKIAGARMLVVAQVRGQAITFVKLVGKAADVEGQREAFLQFCASLRRAP